MRIRRLGGVLAGLVMTVGTLSASAVSAQTDLAVSGYEAFNQNSTGNGVQQTVTNSPGGMLEFRHIQAPWIGYEVTYSLNQEDQTISPVKGSCGYFCSVPPQALRSKTHEVSVDWVAAKKFNKIQAFGIGGFGFMIAAPANYNQYDLNTSVRIAYVYGGGIDWDLGRRTGLRLQYRGNIYKAPDISFDFPTTGRYTHTAEPMIGVYFRL